MHRSTKFESIRKQVPTHHQRPTHSLQIQARARKPAAWQALRHPVRSFLKNQRNPICIAELLAGITTIISEPSKVSRVVRYQFEIAFALLGLGPGCPTLLHAISIAMSRGDTSFDEMAVAAPGPSYI